MKDRFLRYIFTVLALGLVCGGCIGSGGNAADSGKYRTVAAEPLRDTDAAFRLSVEGMKQFDSGNLEKAEKIFKKALEADVKFGPAHNNLGLVYFAQQQWHLAAWEFEYARKLMPKNAAPRNNIGLVLERAGEIDNAIEYYGQAVSLDSRNIEYRANLARAMVRRGDRTDELRDLLRQIQAKDTRPEWISWARQTLATRFGS